MPHIQANNANFYYESHGEGHPLVLISGYTCDSQFYASLLPELTPHFQVLIFDNRGIGRTTDDGQALSCELMAADTIALIEALGLNRPHLLGQSMGGTIAQTVASQYPDKINKLILVTTTAKWRTAMLRGMAIPLRLREENVSFDLIFDSILPWVFGEKFLGDPDTVAFLKDLILNNPYPQSVTDQRRQYRVLETFDGRALLNRIQAPTLILYGTEDLLTLPDESQHLATHIRNSELQAFPCAHDLLHEAGAEAISALLTFLQN